MRKIKGFQPKGSKNILPPEEPKSTDTEPPAFCLRYLEGKYSLDLCTKDERVALINQMNVLSKMSWIQIKGAPPHGSGSEIIKRKTMRVKIPDHISEEVAILSLRFDGKKAMVGFRIGRIFYIVWLDRDFTVYKH